MLGCRRYSLTKAIHYTKVYFCRFGRESFATTYYYFRKIVWPFLFCSDPGAGTWGLKIPIWSYLDHHDPTCQFFFKILGQSRWEKGDFIFQTILIQFWNTGPLMTPPTDFKIKITLRWGWKKKPVGNLDWMHVLIKLPFSIFKNAHLCIT